MEWRKISSETPRECEISAPVEGFCEYFCSRLLSYVEEEEICCMHTQGRPTLSCSFVVLPTLSCLQVFREALIGIGSRRGADGGTFVTLLFVVGSSGARGTAVFACGSISRLWWKGATCCRGCTVAVCLLLVSSRYCMRLMLASGCACDDDEDARSL